MPTILNGAQAAFAQRMYASGESAITIANTLKVSRATVYRSRSVDGTWPRTSAATSSSARGPMEAVRWDRAVAQHQQQVANFLLRQGD